jgi:uncharacterized repeat protein (TIGR01451 family)
MASQQTKVQGPTRITRPVRKPTRLALETLEDRYLLSLVTRPLNDPLDPLGPLTPQDMADLLVAGGSGVSISNVVYTGTDAAAGTFEGGLAAIGFDTGIILTSGITRNVEPNTDPLAGGPNLEDGKTNNNGTAGDTDLDTLTGLGTNDASVLEFDFVPNRSTVAFRFVFASEEYVEYVGSQFNDVFGFFVNGVNCALVGSGDPVSINTIHDGNPEPASGVTPPAGPSNPSLFRNNDFSQGGGLIETEMDGLTTVLSCAAPVTAGGTNHIKLAIADTSDHVLDSAVFIEASSFESPRLDFGDAPNSYGTLADTDGARHAIEDGFFLGSKVDGEADGIPTGDASGDDLYGDNDENDGGVVFLTPLVPGALAEVGILASADGFVDAWIDFDQNGVFDDTDQILASEFVAGGGTTPRAFVVPIDAGIGSTYARFRFSRTGDLSPTGLASSGEVVDMVVDVRPPNPVDLSIDKQADRETALPGEVITYTITVTNTSSTDAATAVTVSDTLPDNVEFISAVPSQGVCSGADFGSVTCDLGDLDPGANAIVSIEIRPLTPGIICNSASVHSTEVDDNPNNNQASVATAIQLTLTPITTPFNTPIGIDYHEPTNNVVISANYPSGVPYNFELVDRDGNREPFSDVGGFTDEVKIGTIRSGPFAGGFAPGELFTGTGVPGVIARISADGTTVQDPWVTLPGETGLLRGSFFQDRYGTFVNDHDFDFVADEGDLIAVTTVGNVWRVSSNGTPTLLASLGTHLEGVTTVPNDSRYGPWAGTILAGAEGQGRIYSIAPDGTTAFFELGIIPEDIDIVPAGENFFGVNYGSGQILGAPASEFAGMQGHVLFTQEFPGLLWDAVWDGNQFKVGVVSTQPQWEHVTFAPAGVVEIEPIGADLTVMKTDSSDPVIAGDRVFYTVTVENAGPDNATGVVLSDRLVGEFVDFTIDGVSTSQGSCSSDLASVTCEIGDLPVGSRATIIVEVTGALQFVDTDDDGIVDTQKTEGKLFNTAKVSGNETDPEPRNNRALEETLVVDDPTGLPGSIHGVKFLDLNGDGVRQVTVIDGDEPEVVFTIDVSSSTLDDFAGTSSVGDVNNDELSDTVLDAELAAFIDVTRSLIDNGFGEVARIGITIFATDMLQLDLDPVTDGVQLMVPAGFDGDADGLPDVIRVLQNIRLEDVEGDVGGNTNFEAGLTGARNTLVAVGALQPNVLFLSDGFITEGAAGADLVPIVNSLLSLGINLRAFGAGPEAELADLQILDPMATVFTTPDELRSVFGGLTTGGTDATTTEPLMPGVKVYLDLIDNGVLDPGEPMTVTMEDDPETAVDETGAYWFMVDAGTYVVREIVPAGHVQTYPNLADEYGGSVSVDEYGGVGHVVDVPDGTSVYGVDFGNAPAGEIHGLKFNDLNGNGVRDGEFIRGDEPTVVFVIDVSQSTEGPFDGSPVGDVNSDTLSDTILDAELAGFIALNQQLIDLGFGQIGRVGIVVFGDYGGHVDMDPLTDGLQFAAAPSTDSDHDGVTDVEQILRSIVSGGVSGAPSVGLGTNYEGALQFAIGTLNALDPLPAPGDANIIFLSDGVPTVGGPFVDEAEAIRFQGINLRAFGAGLGATLDDLSVIDPAAEIFTTSDELLGVFGGLSSGGGSGGGLGSLEPGIGGVEIQLYEDYGGFGDYGGSLGRYVASTFTMFDDPFTEIDETGMYWFTDLYPGHYHVVEVVPDGYAQTAPDVGDYGGGGQSEYGGAVNFCDEYGGFGDYGGAGDYGGVLGCVGYAVDLAAGDVVEGFDFGNIELLGEIHGIKFNDLNGNGIQDKVLVRGDEPTIVFVVDVSSSTENAFDGTPVGDVNGDGLADTILDAQIAGFVALNQELINRGFGPNSRVAITVFGEFGGAVDMIPSTPELDLFLSADTDGTFGLGVDGDPDVAQVLRTLVSGAFGVGLLTNYEAALQVTLDTLTTLAPAADDANVVFLSDGIPTAGGEFEDEVAAIAALGTNIRAFGAGNSASLDQLLLIDPAARIFTTTDDLLDIFGDLGSGSSGVTAGADPGMAGVTVFLDLDNSGTLDDKEPTAVTMADDPDTALDETGMYWFTDVPAGTYTVCEVVPENFNQTYPLITGDLLEPPGESNPPVGDVDPTSLDLSLGAGDMHTSTVSLTLPSGGGVVQAVDVFLLLDDTGSFASNGPIVAAEFPNIISALQTALPGVSLGFGVGRFEEYGNFAAENSQGRPFTLSQPIITADTAGFGGAIDAALSRGTPGFGGDGPETTIEALFQAATGVGFDGNGNGSTLDSGPAGLAATQTTPGDSGDVPEFSSFTADPANSVLAPSGTLGGAGFRAGALPIFIVATDVGTAYAGSLTGSPITGAGGVEVDRVKFDNNSRPTTPDTDGSGGEDGADIQETIDALNSLGALVIGMGTNDDAAFDPRQMLEALAVLTGAVNGSGSAIANGTGDAIDPGDPFYFKVTSGAGSSVANGIVAAVQSAVTSVSFDIDVVSSDPAFTIENLTGVQIGVGEGATASFDVKITGDGAGHRIDLQFVRAGSGVVLGSIPVVVRGEAAQTGCHIVHVGGGDVVTGVDFGNQEIAGSIHGTKYNDLNGNGVRDGSVSDPGGSELSPSEVITVSDDFDEFYAAFEIGTPDGVPNNFGGLTLKFDDPNTLLIGGEANSSTGALYAVPLLRGAGGHIVGFAGPATRFADAANNDGGVAYGPDNVLFTARYPNNELGQLKVGSIATDKIISLGDLGVAVSPGGLVFVPPELPGAGQLKLVSWPGGQFYSATVTPDGTGTFDISTPELKTTIVGGPEGIAYIPSGSPGFGAPSLLVAEYSAGVVSSYSVDLDGNPIDSTRQVLIAGLSGAEGAFFDPFTGDFLFSTFGGGSKIVQVRGFAAPQFVQEPGIPGVQVYLDINNSGEYDAGDELNPGEPLTETMFDDPHTTVDETGMYWFSDLHAGNYVVRELTPSGFNQTFPTSTDSFAHFVELPAGGTIEGRDFGNQAIGGSIHGTKFDDVDADGKRDPGPTVVFVVDRSGSTEDGLDNGESSPGTDINGDGAATILDAEIELISSILAGMREHPANVSALSTVAIVAYADTGELLDLDPVTPGIQSFASPIADADGNGVFDADQALLSLRAGGLTNYEAGLTTADSFFDVFFDVDVPKALFFVGDGAPNLGGDLSAILTSLRGRGVELYAAGIGAGAPMTLLQTIDPLAEQATTRDTLFDVFSDVKLPAAEPGLADWEIFLDDGDGILQPTEQKTTTNADGEYWFMDLPLGSYQVREVPQPASGYVQTLPGGPEFAYGVILTLTHSVATGLDFGNTKDDTPPELTVPPDQTVEATGPDGAVVTFDATATDDLDPNPVVVCTPPSGSTFALGATTVNCTATDAVGNSSAGSFNVTVVDTTPPTIDPHDDVVAEATGPTGAIVNYTSPATNDLVDGVGVATCTPASGGLFPLGDTTVTCTATDSHGNAATPATFEVHVVDTIPPAITVPDEVVVEVDSQVTTVAVNFASQVSATDAVGPVTIECTPPSGSQFSFGTTIVLCTATDGAGNSNAGAFNVIVRDTTPPVLSLPANIIRDVVGAQSAVVNFTVTATDDVDPSPDVTCVPPSGSSFPFGVTQVNCTATDSHGNTTAGSFSVTVRDNQSPRVTGLEFLVGAKAAITDILINVTEPLDPSTAGDVLNYDIRDRKTNKQLPFQVMYPSDATATGNPLQIRLKTFVAGEKTLKGIGANKVTSLLALDMITDQAGNKLDGNSNGVQDAVDNFFDVFARGKEVGFVDATGDKVSVSLKSAPLTGAIEAFFAQDGDLRLLRLVDTNETTQLLGKTAGTTTRPEITGTPFTDLLPAGFVPPAVASAVDEVLESVKPKKPGRPGRLGRAGRF